jgi:RNA-directed DNA polymerase
LLDKLKEIFRRYASQPVERVIELINPILRVLAQLPRAT